ncbi:Hsp20/alpha crystallin family protein [Metabacillus herbersteinensis]|uniref:Hsp20/alpha crystallin family protein n=1 Tax=Metabacillus herbersteinensis TaxID=283816 RepID=A0ABV6GLR9_9BACI
MSKKKKSNPADINGIEEWMTQFFSDPFTNFLDQYTFRIDLFETSEEYIVEAELDQIKAEDITIEISDEHLKILISRNVKSAEHDCVERSVILPFMLEQKVIKAQFENGILEIMISKEETCKRKNCKVPIQVK